MKTRNGYAQGKMLQDVITQIQSILGAGGVLTGEEVHSRSAGLGRRTGCQASAIARPRTTAEVSAVLRACHAAGHPVVPHGGLTGLVEGTLAREQEIVLSLELMNRIEELDEAGMTMTAQAGVILQTVQETCRAAGLMFPLDIGARGSAMMGGIVSTNAGGNGVIRYGMARALVLGLEAVLADGTVLTSLDRILKNNAGYDLKQLFIGSEGTLGVVTRVVLRLFPQPRSRNTALAAVPEFRCLPLLLHDLGRGLGGTLSAFEVMWSDFYQLVTTPPARSAPPLPQSHPYYVLIETQGADPEADERRFEAALMKAAETGLVADCAISKSSRERDALWAARDDVEQLVRFQPLFAFDVSLPIPGMESYVQEMKGHLNQAWPGHRCFVFGHLGDGNLHVIVSPGVPDPGARRSVEEIVYGGLRSRGGSIAAEHGIGLEKRAYLSWCRSPEEIALMRTLKQALDPKGILNPGKILGPPGE